MLRCFFNLGPRATLIRHRARYLPFLIDTLANTRLRSDTCTSPFTPCDGDINSLREKFIIFCLMLNCDQGRIWRYSKTKANVLSFHQLRVADPTWSCLVRSWPTLNSGILDKKLVTLRNASRWFIDFTKERTMFLTVRNYFQFCQNAHGRPRDCFHNVHQWFPTWFNGFQHNVHQWFSTEGSWTIFTFALFEF